MMTWGDLRDYTAAIIGATGWNRLAPEHQIVAQGAINSAIREAWSVMDPSAQVKEGRIQVKANETITVAAVEGNNYFTTTDTVNGQMLHQNIYFNSERHRIIALQTSGGTTTFFTDGEVLSDYTGDAIVTYSRYLLPVDFESFDEVPAIYYYPTIDPSEGQYLEASDFLFDTRQYIDDYISDFGTITITNSLSDPPGSYILTGVNTTWTADLAGQTLRAAGRTWWIKSVNTVDQKAKTFWFETDQDGTTDAWDGVTQYEYTLTLQARRYLELYATGISEIAFIYRAVPPAFGLDHETIPIPDVQALQLGVQYFYHIQSNMGGGMTTAAELMHLRSSLDNALIRLSQITRRYIGSPRQFGVSGDNPPTRRFRDTRISIVNTHGTSYPFARRNYGS